MTEFATVMDLQEKVDEVDRQIRNACDRAKRDPSEVQLIAVSKKFPPERIREAAACGLRIMGENRVQEAAKKIPACPDFIDWHLIGHLQTNKAKDAARLFQQVHSVDSLRLLDALEEGAAKARGELEILIQVNIAGESQKYGVPMNGVEELLREAFQRTHLTVHGLMTMPPFTSDPEASRPIFQKLRELRDRLQDTLSAGLPELSMGMSGDFVVAIEEGATMVRLGTALFGPRSG